jgi:hypothetical protein
MVLKICSFLKLVLMQNNPMVIQIKFLKVRIRMKRMISIVRMKLSILAKYRQVQLDGNNLQLSNGKITRKH